MVNQKKLILKRIQELFPFLCQNTVSLSRLLCYLYSQGQLEEDDMCNFQQSQTKASHIYLHIMKRLRTTSNHQWLSVALNKTGNSHIWRKLIDPDIRAELSFQEHNEICDEDEDIEFPRTGKAALEVCGINSSSVTATRNIQTIAAGRDVKINNYVTKNARHFSRTKKKNNNTTGIYFDYVDVDPVLFYTGRRNYSEEINECFQQLKRKIIVIYGLGGIGKTQTTKKYVRDYWHKYTHIIWIDATNHQTTKRSFLKLADQDLDIRIRENNNEEREISSLKKEIYNKICRKKCLLIFDNAESFDKQDKDGIEYFLPDCIPAHLMIPCILITSRNKFWGDQKCILLNLLSSEESLEFILNQMKMENCEDNKKEARQLESICNGLPLALQQTITFIKDYCTRMQCIGEVYSIAHFAQDYIACKEKDRFLNIKTKDSGCSETLFIIWKVTLQKIKTFDEGLLAIKLFKTICFLYPVQIPTTLLLTVFPEVSKDSFMNAMYLLIKYNMVSLCEKNYIVHKIVQDVTIEHVRQKIKYEELKTLFDTVQLFHNFLCKQSSKLVLKNVICDDRKLEYNCNNNIKDLCRCGFCMYIKGIKKLSRNLAIQVS